MSKRWSNNLQELVVSVLIFLIIFGIYFSSKDTIPVSDSMWSVHIAMSIVKEGNTNLDEYAEVIAKKHNYAVTRVNDHLYSSFPLGTSIAAVPFVFIVDKFSQHFWSLNLYEYLKNSQDTFTLNIELLIASFIATLACVNIYFISRLFLERAQSLILVLISAFCTSIWSTASRGLWQHGPSILMLSMSLYLVLAAKSKPQLVQFVSIPLAYAYVIRPTNSIPVIFITIFVLIQYRRYLPKYLFWATIIAIPFFVFNFSLYHQPLPPYYSPQRIGSNPHFFEALAGNLISPARGLLVYSPIFLFVGYGIILKMKNSQFNKLDGLLLGILFSHWLAISSFPHWWGGHSFGPRFFTDMLPYLMYFLIPVLSEMTLPITLDKLPVTFSFFVLAMISFFIHYRGATQPAVAFGWNWRHGDIVDDVDHAPARLWDWSDPQFWRGLRPANISVTQQCPYVEIQQGEMPEQVLTKINNVGDKPLIWEVKTPYRLDCDLESSPIPALDSYDLTCTIDTTGYNVGVYNLGGICLIGKSASGRLVKDSPIVVPVTVKIQSRIIEQLPQDMPLTSKPYGVFLPAIMNNQRWRERFVPPVDILVNGQAQLTTTNQIRTVYGTGWYDLESMDNFSWRWAMSPSEMYIYSPLRQEVKIKSMPVALYEAGVPQSLWEHGVLNVTTNSQGSTKLSVQIEQPFVMKIELQTGWNVITIESEAGNFRPVDINPSDGDKRQLSFALGEVNLITE